MQISPIFTFQPDAQGESTDKTHSKWLVVTLAQGCNKLGPGPRPPRTSPVFFFLARPKPSRNGKRGQVAISRASSQMSRFQRK